MSIKYIDFKIYFSYGFFISCINILILNGREVEKTGHKILFAHTHIWYRGDSFCIESVIRASVCAAENVD